MIWIVPEIPRTIEPFVGDERAMLEGFLDGQRSTLLHICTGLTGVQLAQRAVLPSALSLLGLIRHVADVERTWVRRRFLRETILPLYQRPDKPDAAFMEGDPDRAEEALVALIDEWAYGRRAVADASLDATFTSERWGEMSLRWIYLHLVREYALHIGHAELLRECLDGTTY